MSEATNLSINIKGPETKLTLSISPNSTVLELKAQIFENASNFPVAQQRLIYSGRVLKDEDQVSKYALKDSHTIHLVSHSYFIILFRSLVLLSRQRITPIRYKANHHLLQ